MVDIVERLRKSRSNTSVLKTKLLSIRSGNNDEPIFIFEGKTDLAPYDNWISRLKTGIEYQPLISEGKSQMLKFRSTLDNSEPYYDKIFYFIDRDYDGLKGYPDGKDILCLNAYSFENYLVNEKVVKSIIRDELQSFGEKDTIDKCLEIFNICLQSFHDAMHEANFRLFLSATTELKRERIESKIKKFVHIDLQVASRAYAEDEINQLIPLVGDVQQHQTNENLKKFEELGPPSKSYRGKFNLDFLIEWIDLLAELRRKGKYPFKESEKISYNRTNLTHRSLASRTDIPVELSTFIEELQIQISN